MKVAVIDGQGGGVGRALVGRVRAEFPDIHIRAGYGRYDESGRE